MKGNDNMKGSIQGKITMFCN